MTQRKALIKTDFQSLQRTQCELFANEVSNFAIRQNTADCLCHDFPIKIRQSSRDYRMPLPPDAIQISVDTRPAQEMGSKRCICNLI